MSGQYCNGVGPVSITSLPCLVPLHVRWAEGGGVSGGGGG